MTQSERYVAWTHRGNLQGVWGAIMGAVFVPAGMFASGGRPPFPFVLLIPIGALIGFAVGKSIGTLLLGASGAAAQRIYMPGAAGTYAQTHSREEHERYVSQKLIDLYLGPLAGEGRALVELRRLIERHPGTREAEGARSAIAGLKGLRG
jgi:hypothetical protein